MLKIGVMGLGNITQKAYLPTMASMQDEYEWHLTTRNVEKGNALAAKYGFVHVHQTLQELLATHPDAVFVHTPTETHEKIVRTLLNAGVNVYVDKPITTDVTAVRSLYALAKAKGVLLTVGFNRRFAPNNVTLKEVANKQMIVVEKTRKHTLQNAEFAVWDLMIHPIDTALWLLDEPVIAQQGRLVCDAAGNLLQGYLSLEGAHSQAMVITNMDANVNLETVTVQGAKERLVSTDLSQLSAMTTTQVATNHRPDWEPMLETRGFSELTRAFLKAVKSGGENPVSEVSAIASHVACGLLISSQLNNSNK